VHLHLWGLYDFFKGEVYSTWLCGTEGMTKHWCSGVPNLSKIKSNLSLGISGYCKNLRKNMPFLQWRLIRTLFLSHEEQYQVLSDLFFCYFLIKPLTVTKIVLLSLAIAALNLVIFCASVSLQKADYICR